MSSVALREQKADKMPKQNGGPRKYIFDKYRDRANEASAALGFPASRENARQQFEGRIAQWARFYFNTHPDSRINFGDLRHFGEIGVMEAYVRFEPSKGVQFNTYCDPWIRRSIRRNLHREIDPVVKSDTREYYKDLKKGLDAFENGDDPSELSKRSGEVYYKLKSGKVTVEGFRTMLSEMKKAIDKASELESLDAPVSSDDDDSPTKKDNIVSPYLDVNETFSDYETIMQRIRFHAYSLIESGKVFRKDEMRAKAAVVFEERCFRDEDEKTNQGEIAEKFNVSRQSIQQVETKLMKHLMPRLLMDPIIREAASAYLDKEQKSEPELL